jgi:hypothetical protein
MTRMARIAFLSKSATVCRNKHKKCQRVAKRSKDKESGGSQGIS